MDFCLGFKSKVGGILPPTFPMKRELSGGRIACRATNISMGEGTNFYKLLSLDSINAGEDAIRRAYRSMALRYHPDVCPPSRKEECTRTFIELRRAYETLSDPVLRERYDFELGLVEGEGRLSKGNRREERSRFSRDVWINQLSELKLRSSRRKAKKGSWASR